MSGHLALGFSRSAPAFTRFCVDSLGQGKLVENPVRRIVNPPHIRIEFPAATAERPRVAYRLEVAAIHPDLPGTASNPLYDGFRRDWLNIFQVNPRLRMLANNASSDPCAFTLFKYALVARETPWTTTDSYPSLVLAACVCAEAAKDPDWARANYDKLLGWAREMMARDTDGDGLVEYPSTGNYGDRPTRERRPSNWWDTINFGHEDAYSNALIHHAARRFAALARSLGKDADAADFEARADKLRAAYAPGFLNPETGLIAGWRSADGRLHDYGFTFVNGAAVTFGLLDGAQANAVMDRLLAKMTEVGYTNFAIGLPGNLLPIRKGDYVEPKRPARKVRRAAA